MFVRIWADERIYLTASPSSATPPTRGARPCWPASPRLWARVVSEGDADGLRQVVIDLLGTGPTMDRRHEGNRLALMPWITLAAFLPLGYVLRRRNL